MKEADAEQRLLFDPGKASKRPSKRRAHDFYPTPSWGTEQLIRHTPELKGDGLYDPTCGDGKMAKQIQGLADCPRFAVIGLNDIDPKSAGMTNDDATRTEAWTGWAEGAFDLDWVVTNPPFNLSGQIAWLALRHAKVGVALLLRITWLEACAGRIWLRDLPPTRLIVLPRISFTNSGDTDSATCAWFVWLRDHGRWNTESQRIIIADPGEQDSLL